jgi:hypothetical protein
VTAVIVVQRLSDIPGAWALTGCWRNLTGPHRVEYGSPGFSILEQCALKADLAASGAALALHVLGRPGASPDFSDQSRPVEWRYTTFNIAAVRDNVQSRSRERLLPAIDLTGDMCARMFAPSRKPPFTSRQIQRPQSVEGTNSAPSDR